MSLAPGLERLLHLQGPATRPFAYSVKAAARAAGVSRMRIYWLIYRKRLDTFRLRGRLVIPYDEVRRLTGTGAG